MVAYNKKEHVHVPNAFLIRKERISIFKGVEDIW